LLLYIEHLLLLEICDVGISSLVIIVWIISLGRKEDDCNRPFCSFWTSN